MNKYLVLKNEDINNALDDAGQSELEGICAAVESYRRKQGKDPNLYLVLNVDEWYAPEVFAAMFKHDHTPCNGCHSYTPNTCNEEGCPWLQILIDARGLIFPAKREAGE